MYALINKNTKEIVADKTPKVLYNTIGELLVDIKTCFWYKYGSEKEKGKYSIAEVNITPFSYDFTKEQAKQEIYSLQEIGHNSLSYYNKQELLKVAQAHSMHFTYRNKPTSFNKALEYFNKYGFKVEKLTKTKLSII